MTRNAKVNDKKYGEFAKSGFDDLDYLAELIAELTDDNDRTGILVAVAYATGRKDLINVANYMEAIYFEFNSSTTGFIDYRRELLKYNMRQALDKRFGKGTYEEFVYANM